MIITFARLVELNSVYFILRFNIVEKRLFWGDEFKDNIISVLVELLILTPSGKNISVFVLFFITAHLRKI